VVTETGYPGAANYAKGGGKWLNGRRFPGLPEMEKETGMANPVSVSVPVSVRLADRLPRT